MNKKLNILKKWIGNNEWRDKMKDKIILFAIGVLVGAVITTGSFLIYTKAIKCNNNKQMMQMPGGNPPSMPQGQNSDNQQQENQNNNNNNNNTQNNNTNQ